MNSPSSATPLLPALALSDEELARVSNLIYRRAGIVLTPAKREMVRGRLSRVVRDCQCDSFAAYLDFLEAQPEGPAWEAFTNALTTNLTGFFREAHHFQVLAQFCAARRSPLRIWSAAVSTGEEAYSIAITVLQTLGMQAQLEIFATDIDTHALAQAERGIYPLSQVMKLTEEQRRYFLRGRGRQEGLARIRPEVQALVRFAPFNLAASHWPTLPQFDLIFCRNVMIYFDRATQERVLRRFAPVLRRGGLLFAGHAENLNGLCDSFQLKGQTVYERV
jgi:Methylase of chemotaxis methyl-accepting proteins